VFHQDQGIITYKKGIINLQIIDFQYFNFRLFYSHALTKAILMKKEKNISGLYGLIFLSFFIFQDLILYSQTSVPDSLLKTRAQKFHKIVDHDRISAQRWWYGWLAGYSAATAGQGIVYFSTDEKATRQDMALGAATTFLGAAGVLITPIVPRETSFQSRDIQPNDSSQMLFDITSSEEMLKEIAKKEAEGRSWKIHAVTGAVNIGSGLITWLGFKRSVRAGLVNFAINTVITEAQIWTQPVKAIKDYQNYCTDNATSSIPHSLKPERKWYLCSYPCGFVLRLDF
jgi:hypothetical protein